MLPQNEVSAIKQELIGLMIAVPSNIQHQLRDAIGVIANSDFWENWDTLVDVCSRLAESSSRKLNSTRISCPGSHRTIQKSTTECSKSPIPSLSGGGRYTDRMRYIRRSIMCLANLVGLS